MLPETKNRAKLEKMSSCFGCRCRLKMMSSWSEKSTNNQRCLYLKRTPQSKTQIWVSLGCVLFFRWTLPGSKGLTPLVQICGCPQPQNRPLPKQHKQLVVFMLFDHPATLRTPPPAPEVPPLLVSGAEGMLGCNNKQNLSTSSTLFSPTF